MTFPLEVTTHPEMVNITARAPATERSKRRMRDAWMKGVSPVDVTHMLPSLFCWHPDGTPKT